MFDYGQTMAEKNDVHLHNIKSCATYRVCLWCYVMVQC